MHILQLFAYNNNEPVGCASIKYYEPEIYEVKRVFVKAKGDL